MKNSGTIKANQCFLRKLILIVSLLLVFCLSGCGGPKPLSSYERGMAFLESNDRNSALTCFEESSVTEGEEALGFRGMGLIYLERGDVKQAITALSNSLDAVKRPRLNKEFVQDTQLYLAKAYEEDGQSDKAMAVYSQLLDGDHAGEAYLLRGKLYAKEGKFGQAGQDFERAIELDSSYEVYLQIYDTYAAVNRQADGAVYLREAQANSSDSAEDAYQLGRINYFLKDNEKAKDNLLKAVNKSVPGAAALLGRIYLDEGDISGARAVYQNAVDNGTDTAAGHNGLALCMIESGEYQQALQQIHEGLLEGDKIVTEELLFNEIIVYERQKDYETALEKMEAFIESYPGNTDARHEYEFLKSRIQEINSTPEDVSEKVWEDIVRQWEEEAAAEEAAASEEYYEEYPDETYVETEEYVSDEVYEETAYDGQEEY